MGNLVVHMKAWRADDWLANLITQRSSQLRLHDHGGDADSLVAAGQQARRKDVKKMALVGNAMGVDPDFPERARTYPPGNYPITPRRYGRK